MALNKVALDRMASPSTAEHDARLDELRGLAICAVFVSHAALVFRNDLALAQALSAPALGVGVDLFFVISGYLVVERAVRSVAKAGGFWLGAAAFWAGRVIRIGVPAWATIAGLYLAARLGALEGARGEDLVAGAGFFANFYWAPCFDGRDGCGDPLLSSHFWSLASEMQFYALAPFIAALRRRSAWLITLAVLAAGAVMSRPWGGFWWALRPDALLVGVMVGMETRGRADWLNRVPEIGIGLASYWLFVAAVLARILSIGGMGIGPVVVSAIFGAVVAGGTRCRRRAQECGREPALLAGRTIVFDISRASPASQRPANDAARSGACRRRRGAGGAGRRGGGAVSRRTGDAAINARGAACRRANL